MQEILQEQAKIQTANSAANAAYLASEKDADAPTLPIDPAAHEENRGGSFDPALDTAATNNGVLATRRPSEGQGREVGHGNDNRDFFFELDSNETPPIGGGGAAGEGGPSANDEADIGVVQADAYSKQADHRVETSFEESRTDGAKAIV